ncbi:hypothetical protein EDC01DRAFT_667859 [Geopyxis carbonaria]|nr:hypothetical protein EDC01DRAFT_667859 [Geopyxis carbonaria]
MRNLNSDSVREENADSIEDTDIGRVNKTSQNWRSPFRVLVPWIAWVFAICALVVPVNATDFRLCCMKRAREIRHDLPLEYRDPFDVCGVATKNSSVIPETYYPSINATRSWCWRNCAGYSEADQLQLVAAITTWMAPAVAYLLLCSTQETSISIRRALQPPENWYTDITDGGGLWVRIVKKISNHRGSLWGIGKQPLFLWIWSYISILGDPGSAIAGAFMEVAMNFHMAKQLSTKSEDSSKNSLLAMVILIGQLELIKPKTSTGSEAVPTSTSTPAPGTTQKSSEKNTGSEEAPTPTSTPASDITQMTAENNTGSKAAPIATSKEVSTIEISESMKSKSKRESESIKRKQGIKLVLLAKKEFTISVAFPCVLAVAVAAGTYTQAYQKKGEAKTSLDLSYSVCYTWLLLLAVCSNCHISTLNSEALGEVFVKYGIWIDDHRGRNTVALRRKYQNATKWMEVLKLNRSGDIVEKTPPDQGSGDVEKNPPDQGSGDVEKNPPDQGIGDVEKNPPDPAWLDLKFVGGQLFGCGCIFFYTACAVAISYTTPTVGIGCRSINFIIYAIMNFVLSCIQIIRWELELRLEHAVRLEHAARLKQPEQATLSIPKKSTKWKKLAYNTLMFVYFFLVALNFFVLIVGTALHFSGQLDRCSCMGIFTGKNGSVEFAVYTKEAVENALQYWLLVGHLSHSTSWALLAMMLVFRRLTVMWLKNHFVAEDNTTTVSDKAKKQLRRLFGVDEPLIASRNVMEKQE